MTNTPNDDVPTKASKTPYGERYKAQDQGEAPKTKKVEKIISGHAMQRKTPLSRKIAETLTGDDAQTVGGYVLFEVIIPALKSMLSEVASQGVERLLFGETRPRSSSSYGRPGATRTNYDRMYQPPHRDEPRRSTHVPQRTRSSTALGEVILRSRGDAEDVIDALGALLEQYDVVTVADLYELVGVTGSFTDDKWGWTDLRGARISRVREGYLLDLPRPQSID